MDGRLAGTSVLVVEDEYLLAMDTERMLLDVGAKVVGPAASCREALALLGAGVPIGAALVDVNLGGEMAFPVIDVLTARGVFVILTTGYNPELLVTRYPQIIRFEKPIRTSALIEALAASLSSGGATAEAPDASM